MDPRGEKVGVGHDPASGDPLLPPYTQQPVPAQGYGAYPPEVAYPPGGVPPPQQQIVQPPPQGQTIVVSGSPQVVVTSSPQAGPGVRPWAYGLFGCFSNINVCILSWCCPCYVVGQNAEALGDSFIVYAIASFFFPLVVQFLVRLRIRGRLQIVGSALGDCLIIWFCTPCALAQDRNEVLDAIQKGQISPNMAPQVIVRQ